MSRIREFERITILRGDHPGPGVRCTCGKCGHQQELPRGSSKAEDVEQVAKRHTLQFEREGWFIGKRQQDDRCPACTKALGVERKPAPPPKNPVMEAKMKEAIAAHEPQQQSAAAREATREEGRIIFAKIEEVYRDEKHGYHNGWSDQRVAGDLGVPVAWVVKVRQQFFGPEGGNEEARQVVEQAKAMLRAVQQVQITTTDQLKAFEREAGLLQTRIDRIEQQMAGR